MSYLFGPKLYLMDLGLGGGSMRMVDVPLIQLSGGKTFSSIGKSIGSSWQRLKRKMQVDGQYSLLPGRPWRKWKR